MLTSDFDLLLARDCRRMNPVHVTECVMDQLRTTGDVFVRCC